MSQNKIGVEAQPYKSFRVNFAGKAMNNKVVSKVSLLGSDDCTLGFKEIGLDCEHSKKTNAQSLRFHQWETVLRHFTKANHRTSSNEIIVISDSMWLSFLLDSASLKLKI